MTLSGNVNVVAKTTTIGKFAKTVTKSDQISKAGRVKIAHLSTKTLTSAVKPVAQVRPLNPLPLLNALNVGN